MAGHRSGNPKLPDHLQRSEALHADLDELNLHEKAEHLPQSLEHDQSSATELFERCRNILKELSEFEQHVENKNKGAAIEIRGFINQVRSELKSVEKVMTPFP